MQYAWIDFVEYLRLDSLVRTPNPRLVDITRRLQLKFEQRLRKPLAVSRAVDRPPKH